MPSRSRKKKRYSNKVDKKSGAKRTKIFLFFSFILFVFVLIFTQSKVRYWSNSDKLSVVTTDSKRNVHVIVIDPISEEVNDMIIPANTEVNVFGNLGVWRLGSVWELGENEGVGGELLVKTVSQHLKIPVYLWADEGFMELLNSNILNKFKTLFLTNNSNMNKADYLRILIFSLKVKDINKTETSLADTNYLQETTLEDGEIGYVSKEDLPPSLKTLFFSYYEVNNNSRVIIRDRTGKYGVSENVAEIIETYGADVAAVIREEEDDINCEVKAKSRELSEYFANIFSCQLSSEPLEGSYDAEIALGSKYLESIK